jgi:NAD(P)-dependent dehydrogenase (short-subunit alcohol dehydrogenase family)
LDLRSAGSISRCFAEFEERWQRLDILVNNAAAGSATVADYEPDAGRLDDALFEINALGAFKVCQEGLKLMQRPVDGASCKLINVASVGGIQVFPSIRFSDSASKAALVHMSRLLAAEHVHTNVDVYVICPGPTDTPMFRRSTLDVMSDDERRQFVSELPKGRLLQPEEVADIIVFLASDYASALHGAVIDASLGLTAHPGLCTRSSALAAATRRNHRAQGGVP